MGEENRRKLAEAKITELELTENLSEAPDEFHETLSRISKHSRLTASQRVSDWVNYVNSEPPQPVTTEANVVAESSNPPVASTTPTREVVQSGYPNQLAALASGLNTFPPEQQLNVAAVNFSMPVITNSSPPSLAAVSHLPFRHVPSAAAPTTLITVPPHLRPQICLRKHNSLLFRLQHSLCSPYHPAMLSLTCLLGHSRLETAFQ